MLYAIPLAAVAGASAFGWMLGYLRGPDIVAAWIADFAGTDAGLILLLLVLLFVIIGDFVDAVPAIIILQQERPPSTECSIDCGIEVPQGRIGDARRTQRLT